MTLPTVGIIHARGKHPSAKRLADLQEPEIAGLVLADASLPLDEALEKEWPRDSHLILYRIDADEQGEEFCFARASKRSPFVKQLEAAGGRVRISLLVFDHDLPKLKGKKQPWSAGQLDEFVQVLEQQAGASIPEPTAWYTTLHGSRFIYVLSEEVGPRDVEEMSRGLIQQFAQAGIELDESCQDWTRLFRLPKTVREDTGEPFYTDERFLLLTGGPVLNVANVPRIETGKNEKFAEVDQYEGEMPDPDEVRELLQKGDGRGRISDSDLVSTARRYLTGREAFDVIFKDRPLAVGDTNWNNQVTKIVGQTVGMLARQEGVTAEGIYALLHSSVEQLQAREQAGVNETDWYEKTWDLVCRMWANEQAQIESEEEERRERQKEAEAHKETLVERLREARPEYVPEDEEEAKEWFNRRMIASNGRQHYVMRKDGSYNYKAVPDSMLIPMIRELGMGDMIPTETVRGKSVVTRTATDILNCHATPILDIECSALEDLAFIEGDQGYKVLHIPIHHLNTSKLAPGGKYDERVDEWLRALGGDQYEMLVEWLSHALDVKRPICALNLYGSAGTGKGMLSEGLSECFRGETKNDGRALGKWNSGLLRSPIVNCDEGVPNISSDEALTLDQAFRSMVTGGKMTIRAMRTDPFTAELYPRILFTSNDRDIIRSIVGHRDLTTDDIKAIELRLLSIHVKDEACRLLTSRGNYAYTSGWVAGEKPSRYILANHIYYLYCNRKPSQRGTGRLLVEGETSTALVREMRLRSKGAQLVLRSLVKMLETPQVRKGLHVHDNRVWVLPAAIVEFAENGMTAVYGDITLPVAGRILRQFSVDDFTYGKVENTNPPGTARDQRGRWIEIDLGLLFEEGMRYGLTVSRIEKMLANQPGGEDVIAAVMSFHKDTK